MEHNLCKSYNLMIPEWGKRNDPSSPCLFGGYWIVRCYKDSFFSKESSIMKTRGKDEEQTHTKNQVAYRVNLELWIH